MDMGDLEEGERDTEGEMGGGDIQGMAQSAQ